MNKYKILGVRNQRTFSGYALLDSYRNTNSLSQCGIRKALWTGEEIESSTYYHQEDADAFVARMEKEISEGIQNSLFFEKMKNNFVQAVKILDEEKLRNSNNLSSKELIEQFTLLYEAYKECFHPMMIAVYASGLKKRLKELLEKESNTVFEDMTTLITPNELSFVQKEALAIYETLNEDRDIEDLAKDFGFFHRGYMDNAWTKKEYQILLDEYRTSTKEFENPLDKIRSIKKKQNTILKRYDSKELVELVGVMQAFQMILDSSKEYLIRTIHKGKPLLEEIAKRIGVQDWIKVRELLPEEIIQHLKKGSHANKEIINLRYNTRAVLLEDGELKVFEGDEAKQIIKNLVHTDESDSSIKGETAFAGKVKGIVKIITSAKDLAKMNEGNVLVTKDTTTELTSAIKKAAAIVADHGSFLSHTSIVAREFKIPCIIKTFKATTLLKDGDKVEVDATKGTVRKL